MKNGIDIKKEKINNMVESSLKIITLDSFYWHSIFSYNSLGTDNY
jgi:hypothetical protein